MSITDELREWANDSTLSSWTLNELTTIADRIDAEHQKALDEWKAKHGQMWLKGYAECHAELLEGNETLASDLESCGWVRLPKDADGEYIRIGDVMEFSRFEIDCPVTREVVGVGKGVFFAWCGERGYEQLDVGSYRHYHAPTVEDVLREFAQEMNDNMGMYTGEAIDADEWRDADAKTVEKYAAKLQLREDA